MTALSGLVQPGGAYLFTDGASFDAQHHVCAIGTKVLSFERQRMAIGWSGYVNDIDELEAAIIAAGPTQADIFAPLPTIVEQFASANVAIGTRDNVPPPPLRLLIALWCEKSGEGQLWAIHSGSEIFGSWYKPCTLVRLSQYMALPPDLQVEAFGRLPAYADPMSFDVLLDGLTLLEAERALPYEDGHYAVGGFAELTSVTAAGVEQQVLRRWPDRIGFPISL